MSKHKANIEKLFRENLENFEIQPSRNLWGPIRLKLIRKQFLRFNPRTFNVFYASSLIIGISIAYLVSRDAGETLQKNNFSAIAPSKEVVIQVDTIQNIPVQNPENLSPAENNPSIKKQIKADADIHSQIKSPPVIIISPSGKIEEKQNSVIMMDSSFTTSKLPLAYFTSSIREGCAPLTVEFRNLSENDIYSSWSFGDGGTSTNENPAYIFDEPGTYFISLTIATTDRQVSAFTDSIHVHPLPRISFNVDKSLNASEPVYFYNNTKGAEYYHWDFGDGNNSDLKEPSHYYQETGNYTVRLSAWTSKGCLDSMILKNAFSLRTPSLRFPNAFTPNISGPGNGYYSINSADNTVFHPYTDEEVMEYQLRIFTREGLLVFESNDINIGWDGYYQQKLLPQKVYIWKARGKFAEGKGFVQTGNVALIWKKER